MDSLCGDLLKTNPEDAVPFIAAWALLRLARPEPSVDHITSVAKSSLLDVLSEIATRAVAVLQATPRKDLEFTVRVTSLDASLDKRDLAPLQTQIAALEAENAE